MKIIAYEVREDERQYFHELGEKTGVELILTEEIPSPENAFLAAGCDGVTTLGQGNINAELLDV